MFCTGYPFTEHLRYTIAPPGHVPLHNKMFSLVDVPDLQALAVLWPEADEIWMGAAPVPELLHRFLAALAWLVRLRLLPTLSPIAPLMHFATNHIRWGEHRGGMFVEVDGVEASGARLKRSWHLLAEGDDGPLIPVHGRRSDRPQRIAGTRAATGCPCRGARIGARRLRAIVCRANDPSRECATTIPSDAPPLYARILGDAWRELPAQIRDMHDVGEIAAAEGRARVERGGGILARLACALIGFPQTNLDTSVGVQFDVSNGVETWTRTFGSDRFSSRQFAGRARSERLLCERFGALTFAMALVAARRAPFARIAPLEHLRLAAADVALSALRILRKRRAGAL